MVFSDSSAASQARNSPSLAHTNVIPPFSQSYSLFPSAALYCSTWCGMLLLWECCKWDLFGKWWELWEYQKWACGGHEKEAVSVFVHSSPCISRMPTHRPALFMHYYSLFTSYLFITLCLLFKRYKDTKKKISTSRRFVELESGCGETGKWTRLWDGCKKSKPLVEYISGLTTLVMDYKPLQPLW